MPVRFQVDPDFYDHPKSLGMSDAATALWVRAGSYSAAKLTDGFIAEHVLALLSLSPQEASDELRRRGLWHKVRGGYRFHEWDDRNLTRSRVEGDRKADRERKKANRTADKGLINKKNGLINNTPSDDERSTTSAGSNGNPQAKPTNVRPESERNPAGIQAESERIPAVSVSVSVSESVSGSGHGPAASSTGGSAPSPRCAQHLNDNDPPPCGQCAEARKARTAWEVEQAKVASAARSSEARTRAIAKAAVVDACNRCDSNGYRMGRLCPHDADSTTRNSRGAALVAAAITKPKPPAAPTGDATARLNAAVADLPPLTYPVPAEAS